MHIAGIGKGKVSGPGLSCTSKCTQRYRKGRTVTLTAAAGSGSHFTKWAGACSGTTASCTLQMRAAETVQAVFTKAIVPKAGSYSGNNYVAYYVSYSHKALQDVTTEGMTINCSPGGTAYVTPTISSIPIKPGGAFSATSNDRWDKGGIAYSGRWTFAGHLSSDGTALGTFSDTVTYNDGSPHTCKSGKIGWNSSYDSQGKQAKSSPPAGSYSAATTSASTYPRTIKRCRTSPVRANTSTASPAARSTTGPSSSRPRLRRTDRSARPRPTPGSIRTVTR